MMIYYSDSKILVRSMVTEDARIIYDTYSSYGWNPLMETYENYYKEQEKSRRKAQEKYSLPSMKSTYRGYALLC